MDKAQKFDYPHLYNNIVQQHGSQYHSNVKAVYKSKTHRCCSETSITACAVKSDIMRRLNNSQLLLSLDKMEMDKEQTFDYSHLYNNIVRHKCSQYEGSVKRLRIKCVDAV